MNDPLEAITDLLAEDHGVPRAKLHPAARIGHDLGVDGDDASDLFQRLHERFGTDFTPLNHQWTEFFNNEGASPRAILLTLLLLIPSTALTLWISVSLKLDTGLAGAIGLVIFFALWFAINYLLPRKQKRPVTIDGLAEVVRAGVWPENPEKVR